jgi:hypothetical protein
VVEEDGYVIYCGQGWKHFANFPFPPTDRVQPFDKKWMGDSQATLASLYGWTALVMLVGFFFFFFGGNATTFFMSWFRGMYTPSGQDQHIDFSASDGSFAYVPQIRWGGFPFPFLACDVDRIDQGLIGWNDPSRSYDFHNVMFDVPWEGMPRKKNTQGDDRPRTLSRPIFSIIKHYPPEWAKKLEDQRD